VRKLDVTARHSVWFLGPGHRERAGGAAAPGACGAVLQFADGVNFWPDPRSLAQHRSFTGVITTFAAVRGLRLMRGYVWKCYCLTPPPKRNLVSSEFATRVGCEGVLERQDSFAAFSACRRGSLDRPALRFQRLCGRRRCVRLRVKFRFEKINGRPQLRHLRPSRNQMISLSSGSKRRFASRGTRRIPGTRWWRKKACRRRMTSAVSDPDPPSRTTKCSWCGSEFPVVLYWCRALATASRNCMKDLRTSSFQVGT